MTSPAPIPGPAMPALASVAEELASAARTGYKFGPTGRICLPSRDSVLRCVDGIRQALFPGFFGGTDLDADGITRYVGETLERIAHDLLEQIARAVGFAEGRDFATCSYCKEFAERATDELVGRLPEVRRKLVSDVDAAFEGDPALKIKEEAIFSYPGVLALSEQRIAHELHLLGVPLIPRMITENAHSMTGIDIHPGASIGDHFFIDHGTGVVIGETARIGRNVRIYQGVTLGARSFPLDRTGNPIKGIDRHPIVEDDVVVYAGATLLGRITIGRGSSIGGNVWLTHSVPPGSRITQAEAKELAFEDGGGI